MLDKNQKLRSLFADHFHNMYEILYMLGNGKERDKAMEAGEKFLSHSGIEIYKILGEPVCSDRETQALGMTLRDFGIVQF